MALPWLRGQGRRRDETSDVDAPAASKPPEVNEKRDRGRFWTAWFTARPGGRRSSLNAPQIKAQFNKPQLRAARRGAASSFQPGLIRTTEEEGVMTRWSLQGALLPSSDWSNTPPHSRLTHVFLLFLISETYNVFLSVIEEAEPPPNPPPPNIFTPTQTDGASGGGSNRTQEETQNHIFDLFVLVEASKSRRGGKTSERRPRDRQRSQCWFGRIHQR